MNARPFLLLLGCGALVAAGGYHWQARRTEARLAEDLARTRSEIATAGKAAADAAERLAALQRERQARAEKQAATAKAAAVARAASSAVPAPQAPASPELRGWQVSAFVSEQRLRHAGLFRKLGFTPERLQAFDRIQGDYQRAALEEAAGDATRKQAQQVRDQRLQELFGPDHEQWLEANRALPDRAVVDRIVQQTFPSSGTLTTAQADELTRIIGSHRSAPAPGADGGQPRYDWERVIAEARTVLHDRQMDDFISAVEYRRASDRMSALAARKP